MVQKTNNYNSGADGVLDPLGPQHDLFVGVNPFQLSPVALLDDWLSSHLSRSRIDCSRPLSKRAKVKLFLIVHVETKNIDRVKYYVRKIGLESREDYEVSVLPLEWYSCRINKHVRENSITMARG